MRKFYRRKMHLSWHPLLPDQSMIAYFNIDDINYLNLVMGNCSFESIIVIYIIKN